MRQFQTCARFAAGIVLLYAVGVFRVESTIVFFPYPPLREDSWFRQVYPLQGYWPVIRLLGALTLTMKILPITSLVFALSPTLLGQTWPAYGGDAGGQRYSPLTEINSRNVTRLKVAWQYRLASGSEGVPIMIGGLLFSPTVNHTIVALQPETGTEVWKLIALDAMTGKLVPGFAKEGTLDLREGVTQRFPKAPYHMSSPGAIYRNLIITGAQGKEDDPDGPAMDVRAWDLRTGNLVWTFHTIPHPGEAGYETWPKDNLDKRGIAGKLGLCDCGRSTGLGVFAGRATGSTILRRRTPRGQSLLLFNRRPRSRHGKGPLALSNNPP